MYKLEYGVGLLWKYQEEQQFQPNRLKDYKNEQFYSNEYAHKDDVADEPSEGNANHSEEM